jgi:phosphoribosylformylglycinamidine cyclo-ligase
MADDSYLKRGVSPTKDEVHEAIKAHDAGLYPGAFCKIIDDLLDDNGYCSIMHADGAGTKSLLAYLHFKETGDASVFNGIAQDSMVMNLDDLMCVGATSDFIVSNTIGRNAHRINGEVLKQIIGGYQSFSDLLRSYGINTVMSGGETADVGDLVATVIIDSTVFCRLKRSDVIDCSNIRAGDVIVGLASYGQASYEDSYNSGIGSNGFTAARHMLLSHTYAYKYPETYSSTLQGEDIYGGTYLLSDTLPGSNQSVGEAILSPTRTYLPIMQQVYQKHRSSIHGVIHSSGGGQVKCKAFGSGLNYIKDTLFEPPAIFKALAATESMSDKEMYQVFNMGQRLEIYCDESTAQHIIATAQSFSVDAQIIGRVEKHTDDQANQVTITTAAGETIIY